MRCQVHHAFHFGPKYRAHVPFIRRPNEPICHLMQKMPRLLHFAFLWALISNSASSKHCCENIYNIYIYTYIYIIYIYIYKYTYIYIYTHTYIYIYHEVTWPDWGILDLEPVHFWSTAAQWFWTILSMNACSFMFEKPLPSRTIRRISIMTLVPYYPY